MIYLIILIGIVLIFTIVIAIYLEKNNPKEIDNNTDSVDVIFDDDKEDKEVI